MVGSQRRKSETFFVVVVFIYLDKLNKCSLSENKINKSFVHWRGDRTLSDGSDKVLAIVMCTAVGNVKDFM